MEPHRKLLLRARLNPFLQRVGCDVFLDIHGTLFCAVVIVVMMVVMMAFVFVLLVVVRVLAFMPLFVCLLDLLLKRVPLLGLQR